MLIKYTHQFIKRIHNQHNCVVSFLDGKREICGIYMVWLCGENKYFSHERFKDIHKVQKTSLKLSQRTEVSHLIWWFGSVQILFFLQYSCLYLCRKTNYSNCGSFWRKTKLGHKFTNCINFLFAFFLKRWKQWGQFKKCCHRSFMQYSIQ